MTVKPLNEGKNIKGLRPLLPLHPLSSFPLVFAFANVLMSCVVTMVSNVSDISDAWPGMLLHAHMLERSLMPHRAGLTQTSTCTYTLLIHKQSVRARVQSAVCQDRAAAASCMRGETSCCLDANCGRSAEISANQLC